MQQSRFNSIRALFSDERIERVTVAWTTQVGTRSGLSARTVYAYLDHIRLMLGRVGHTTGAKKIDALCKGLPVLKEGKAANKFMSAATEQWCLDLLKTPQKLELFEMQHVRYAEKAEQALRAAEEAGFDLLELSDPKKMKALPKGKRSAAKKLLRRARSFGVCAAFAAIELEAAPFRKTNTLKLTRSGTGQTFFDHRGSSPSYFEILLPIELLKNRVSLKMRRKSLPPFQIQKGARGDGNYAFVILDFFLKRIRPLFPGAKTSRALFAPIDPAHPHLVIGTFDEWLRDCSIEIDLPLTPHNFRHGVCSIEIREDPSCIDQLADLLGDHPDTVRRYYAFIDREEQARKMQSDRAQRRKGYASVAKASAA